jgi:hypothetical protein
VHNVLPRPRECSRARHPTPSGASRCIVVYEAVQEPIRVQEAVSEPVKNDEEIGLDETRRNIQEIAQDVQMYAPLYLLEMTTRRGGRRFEARDKGNVDNRE